MSVHHNYVLPYFIKSENNLDIEKLSREYHGDSGEQPISMFHYLDEPSIMIIEAFNESGLPILDFNAETQFTVFNSQAISDGRMRVSANKAFIQSNRYKRKNLTVKVKSEVFKILINNKNVAYGVKYRRNSTVYTAVAKKEVIVSAGAINTPKLLMLSGIGPKEHLQNLNIDVKKNLAVGENLHDHVTFNEFILNVNKASTMIGQEQILNEVRKYKEMKYKRGPLTGDGPSNALAFIKTESNLIAPDIQYQIGNVYVSEYVQDVAAGDATNIFPTSFYDGMLIRPMYLTPKSRGKLLLNETNPHGPPLLYPNYLEDSDDIAPIIKALKYAINLENTKAFKARGAYYIKESLEPCTNYYWGSDEYFTCMIRSLTSTTHHQVGTCKMGPKSDKKAVVDSKLRVYGISRLRVIDASIMPRVTRGNTCAPSLMIGERGVAFVIDKWLKNKS